MLKAQFTVDVTNESANQFAELSGDWNPLHTDQEYAASTSYGRPILHGAYSAGLISRLAGMELPGKNCLLLEMKLRFVNPIYLPASLIVEGKQIGDAEQIGTVEAQVRDAKRGTVYVASTYAFSRLADDQNHMQSAGRKAPTTGTPAILVTGASGGIGSALVNKLGKSALGVSSRQSAHMICIEEPGNLMDGFGDRPISAIIHCAWPGPDNRPFVELADPGAAIDHNVAQPLRYIQALAKLLAANGTPNAPLVLIGSTAGDAGRHNFRTPLYSLAKSMIPTLVRILALELAPYDRRAIGITFDVVAGGMNASISRVALAAHKDRSPFGSIPSPQEAADQIAWVLDNPGTLATGANLILSGGAMP